jgi:hypothetical protein
MSDEYLVIRHELITNALAAINSLYSERLGDIQSVKDGDGATLKTIHWGVFTPRFTPKTTGYLPQWTHQEIELELRASVDYGDRSLDSRYLTLLQVFEDFCAMPDLAALLSSDSIVVQSPPTFEDGAETIENGRYITSYRLHVSARGRMEGE